MQVDDNVAQIMKEFHQNRKVIGLICISPIIAAKVFGGNSVQLTLGSRGENWPYAGALDTAKSLGAKTLEMDVKEICTDYDHRLVTTPAYMQGNAKPHEVVDGVARFVR